MSSVYHRRGDLRNSAIETFLDHAFARIFFSITIRAAQIANEPTMTVHPENMIIPANECELLCARSAPAAGLPKSDLSHQKKNERIQSADQSRIILRTVSV